MKKLPGYLIFILSKLKLVRPELYLAWRLRHVFKIVFNLLKSIVVDNGIISKELTKAVSKKADEDINLSKIAFVGPLLEMADDNLIYLVLNYIDEKHGNKVPVQAREAVVALFEAYVSEDWESVTDEVADAVNAFVDIPLLEEDFEGNMIKGILDALIKFIKSKKQ